MTHDLEKLLKELELTPSKDTLDRILRILQRTGDGEGLKNLQLFTHKYVRLWRSLHEEALKANVGDLSAEWALRHGVLFYRGGGKQHLRHPSEKRPSSLCGRTFYHTRDPLCFSSKENNRLLFSLDPPKDLCSICNSSHHLKNPPVSYTKDYNKDIISILWAYVFEVSNQVLDTFVHLSNPEGSHSLCKRKLLGTSPFSYGFPLSRSNRFCEDCKRKVSLKALSQGCKNFLTPELL